MKGFGSWWRKRRARDARARLWRAAIFSAARDPKPYQSGWVEDTQEGRGQMLAIVTALVVRRFQNPPVEDTKQVQSIMEAVFQDVDDSLREQGVGDASIARKMRKFGEEFVGLGRALDKALDSNDSQSIEALLVRNGVCPAQSAPDLLGWIMAVEARLSAVSDQDRLTSVGPDMLARAESG